MSESPTRHFFAPAGNNRIVHGDVAEPLYRDGVMVRLLRHLQTKGAETDRLYLIPSCHTFTSPEVAIFLDFTQGIIACSGVVSLSC